MKRQVCRLAVLASVVIALLLPQAASAELRFVSETIDSLPSSGRFYPSLALDSGGRPHVSYLAVGSGAALKYASKTSNAWTIETVAPSADWGAYTTVALDGRGEPRILYHSPDGFVKCATRTAGAWTFETVGAGRYGSLALSPEGSPHVAYAGNGGIQYARKSNGIWLTEAVDVENTGLSHCRIGLGPQGDVHIAYWDYEYSWEQDLIRYARRQGGSWFREVATDLQYLDEDLSLAIDEEGSPHITYANRLFEGPTLASYLRRTDAGWIREGFDSPYRGYSYAGMGSSVAIDAHGRPCVTYGFAGVFGPNEFRYRKRLPSGDWTTPETVDTRDGGGYWATSIALDRAGTVNAIYRTAGVLKFARRVWVAVPVPEESLAKKESATAAGEPLTLWVAPNPTSSEVEIRYRSGNASEALIDVVDVQGRRVFRAVSNAGGADRVRWRTTDDLGRRIASGVYYVSVRANGVTATTKLVVTR
ncbi:MAG: T9SS type A sorting domain-containing protein [bacterium]